MVSASSNVTTPSHSFTERYAIMLKEMTSSRLRLGLLPISVGGAGEEAALSALSEMKELAGGWHVVE